MEHYMSHPLPLLLCSWDGTQHELSIVSLAFFQWIECDISPTASLLLCSLNGMWHEPPITSLALLIRWNVTWATHRLFCFFHWIECDMSPTSSLLLCSLNGMWHEPPITSSALLLDGMWHISKPPIVSFDLLIGRNATWAIHRIFCFDHLDRTQHEQDNTISAEKGVILGAGPGTYASKKNCRNYFTCTPDGLVSFFRNLSAHKLTLRQQKLVKTEICTVLLINC